MSPTRLVFPLGGGPTNDRPPGMRRLVKRNEAEQVAFPTAPGTDEQRVAVGAGKTSGEIPIVRW